MKQSTNYGFSPRIEPRPAYPSALSMVLLAIKETCYQSGTVGTLLSLLFFPYYFHVVAWLKSQLGEEYGSDRILFTIILSVIHVTSYTVINGSFGLFDYLGWFQQYKLARKPYMQPTTALLSRTLLDAAVGQLLLGPAVLYVLHPRLVYWGLLAMDAPVPATLDIFKTFVYASLVNSIGFYWAHRIFHSKPLYATFHKQHHEYTGSIGISAEYAGPVETVLANQLPTMSGVIFFGCHHPFVVFVWLALRLQQTYEAHSGFCFNNTIFDYLGLAHANDCAHHDYHHSVNKGNFGGVWMDWIFGTMDGYCADGYHEGAFKRRDSSKKTKGEE